MDGYLLQASIGMPRGSLLRIDDGAGILLYVWEGELWLTQDGSRKDHFLRAGQWMRVQADGATVAQACRRSVVALSSPEPEPAARRVSLVKPGASAPAVLYRRRRMPAWQALRARLAGSIASHPTPTSI